MHTENCPSVKLSDGSEVSSLHSGFNASILEEDLAISSSTYGVADKTSDGTDHEYHDYKSTINKVVYLNEDTMDCSYAESSGTPKKTEAYNLEVSSPEMFESDDEAETEASSRKFRRLSQLPPQPMVQQPELTPAELVVKSDNHLLSRVHKFLTGIPPPPKHTICQSDCGDFLTQIRQNRQYFWVDPFADSQSESDKAVPDATTSETTNDWNLVQRSRTLRNLTSAFDACDQTSSSVSTNSRTEVTTDCATIASSLSNNLPPCSSTDSSSETSGQRILTTNQLCISSLSTNAASTSTLNNKSKHVRFDVPEEYLGIYNSIDEVQARNLPWPEAIQHKAHGLHYNRSIAIEEFENLSTKLCQRYIGNETQSTCTVWFTKQPPGSAKKRTLLARRVGQSPGKRLSHLARRTRTFSKANLKGMAEKSHFTVTVKKQSLTKGKSPRGKSPRGSAKKRLIRRISLDGPSPRKSKLETSKRALFQSPPLDRAGPSRVGQLSANNSQHAKRVLFPTPQKNEETNGSEETSKKRKSEEELEGPRTKWAKSTPAFNCSYSLDSSRDGSRSEKYSMGSRAESQAMKKREVNRRKLFWAVSEALKPKGIIMGHPKFKQYASELAKTVKKYMPELENENSTRKSGSTTDRMLKLAKTHVLLVVETKCH